MPLRWNKFKNHPVKHAGMSFASKGESRCYDMLVLEEQAGLISNIRAQASVYLTDARILYKPDFCVFDHKLNEDVYVEYKGMETPVWRIKRRLWMHYGPGRLRVYKGKNLHEEIIPKNK